MTRATSAVEEAKTRQLRRCFQPAGYGAAHVVGRIGSAALNGGVEGLAQRSTFGFIDRVRDGVLWRGEAPFGDFGSEPSFLVSGQSDVHKSDIKQPERTFQMRGFPDAMVNFGISS